LNSIFHAFNFEDLPASDKDPISPYLDDVKNSDIYIGLIGAVPGKPNEDSLSPTDLEFKVTLKQPHGDTFVYIKDTTTERDEKFVLAENDHRV